MTVSVQEVLKRWDQFLSDDEAHEVPPDLAFDTYEALKILVQTHTSTAAHMPH